MIIGKVVGSVVSTRKNENLVGNKFMIVEPTKEMGISNTIVAIADVGAGIGEMESNVLKERKQLSEDGLCIVILNVNTKQGVLNSRPEIVSRGFTYTGEAQTWLEDAKATIEHSVDADLLRNRDYLNVKIALRKALTNYLNKKLKRKPMIVPIIIESND